MAESAHSALTGANLHNVKQHNHDADTEAGGGKLSGAVVDTFLELAEGDAPGTATAGHVRLYAKTDGSLYQKDDAGTETGLAGGGGGGGSGDSTLTGAAASRPAASNDGDLYLPNDAPLIFRDTGAAYAAWGPLWPLTLPVSGDFAWVNQDTATLTDNGALVLTAPSAGFAARVKTAPATPYTIDALFLFSPVAGAGTLAFGWRQSSDGKLAFLRLGFTSNAYFYRSSKYTSPTVFSADYITTAMHHRDPIWLRIQDDGTNRSLHSSLDHGRTWSSYHSIGRTDFLTPDQVLWGNGGGVVTLLSWKES